MVMYPVELQHVCCKILEGMADLLNSASLSQIVEFMRHEYPAMTLKELLDFSTSILFGKSKLKKKQIGTRWNPFFIRLYIILMKQAVIKDVAGCTSTKELLARRMKGEQMANFSRALAAEDAWLGCRAVRLQLDL